MKKTIVIYSVFAGLIMLLYLVLMAVGLNTIREMAPYLLPVSALFLLFSLAVDSRGLLCVIIGLLPFCQGILTFEIGPVTFNPYTLGMIGFAVFSLFSLPARDVKMRHGKLNFFVIMLSCCYAISTFLSANLMGTGFLAFHAIFIPVISYFVLVVNLRDEEMIQNVNFFFCLGIFFFGLFSIGEFILSGKRENILGIPPIGVATLTIFPILQLLMTSKWKQIKYLPVFMVYCFTLLFTFSRVYLIMAFLSPFIFNLFKRGKAYVVISVMFVSTFVISTITPLLVEPLSVTATAVMEINKQEKSYERLISPEFWKYTLIGRALSYKEGLYSFIEHPIFGTGIQVGYTTTKDLRRVGNVTIHNFHIEWLKYGGVIGYAIYAGIFLVFFKKLNSFAMINDQAAMILTSIFIMLCNSLTNGLMHGIMPVVIFVLMGLGIALYNSQNEAT